MQACWNRVVAAVVMSATFAAVCPQTAQAGLVEHLDLAELLVATVLPAVNYYGDPTSITWEGENNLDHSTNRSKCATLVTQLFERAYDPDYVAWFGCTSPHAASYHDAIEVEHGFTLIESIKDVQPGDIIAIEYLDAGCTNLTCGTFSTCTTTGHVAIVADVPKLRTASAPLVAGTTQYTVDIIDTSTSYHGALGHPLQGRCRRRARPGRRRGHHAPLRQPQGLLDRRAQLEHLVGLGVLRQRQARRGHRSLRGLSGAGAGGLSGRARMPLAESA